MEISAQYSKHSFISTVALVLVKRAVKVMKLGAWSYRFTGYFYSDAPRYKEASWDTVVPVF